MNEPQLNDEQQKGYQLLMEFVNSKEKDRMFCLKGYAGTGKTFLISKVVRDILEQNKKLEFWDQKSVAMTAPTNKAVQVLRESSGLEEVTFKTIHSLLGLKEVIKDSGEIEFEKAYEDASGNIKDFSVLIIDEVSMLHDNLFFEIKRYNNEVKIIMMGDPAQIPPVGKHDCEPFLKPASHGIIEFQMKQIMRQAEGSAIVSNSFQLRDNLEDDSIDFVPGNDLKMLSASREREELKKRFVETFTDVSVADHTKVIAWTNKKVSDYNRYIRSLLFGPNIPKLMIGERLVLNSPHPCDFDQDDEKSDKKKKKPKRNYELLTTNQEVVVESFEVMPTRLPEGIFNCYIARINFTSQSGKPTVGRIKIIHESANHDFLKELGLIKRDAVQGPSHDRKKNWKRFYEFLRSVADVQYSYAITAHKSQGSTYRATFLDIGNISLNPKIVERNRIMYTALTRAKTEVTLIV